MIKQNNRVSPLFPVSCLLEKALACLGIDHRSVTDQPFAKQGNVTETLFVGACPGTKLYPVHMDIHGPAVQAASNASPVAPGWLVDSNLSVRRGSCIWRSARSREKPPEARTTLLDGLDKGWSSGLFIREPISLAYLNADNPLVLVKNESNKLGAGLYVHTQLLCLFKHLVDQLGPGGIDGLVGPLHRMASMKVEPRKVRTHICFAPLKGTPGLLGDNFSQIRMVEVHPCLEHVFQHEVGRVLNLCFLLQLGPRSAKVTTVDDRVAPMDQPFFRAR